MRDPQNPQYEHFYALSSNKRYKHHTGGLEANHAKLNGDGKAKGPFCHLPNFAFLEREGKKGKSET